MKKLITHSLPLLSLFWLLAIGVMAQTRISGKITAEATKEELAGISIAVKGKVIGTITDQKGNFSLSTNTPTPFTIAISAVGFQPQEFAITGDKTGLTISLKEQVTLGQEIIVSASRVEESVLKSPVSVERLDIRSFQSTPAATFYDALQNIKGVDMSTQSLTFKSVNVRGFGNNGNTRVVQLLDGMDNQAPGLNFSVGNIAGVSELDLESVELLPGAASALYGPNAINGLLLMTSKSPFLYQGLSAYVKGGVMNASNRSTATTPFYDAAFRYAKAFNNRLAFKVGVSYLTAKDWQATDYRDQGFSNGYTLENGTRANNAGYDGINIYGDASANLYSNLYGNGQPGTGANGTSQILGLIASTPIPQAGNRTLPQLTGQTPQQIFNAIIPNLNISRTGYAEQDLVNYNATNLKLNGALHYRLNDNVEAILQANWGTGTTVFTGADRYYLKGFKLGQYKLELKGSNFFVRAYTTQERSGDSYATSTLGQGINEAWSGSAAKWFPTYFGTYAQTAFQGYAGAFLQTLGSGQTAAAAATAAQTYASSQQSTWLNLARGTADQGRLLPGTAGFQQAFDAVTGKSIPGDATGVGARFLDKTNLYQAEGMYNFSKLVDPKLVEVLVGASFRRYALNSEGTLFARDESGREFNIDEYGAYVQASKTLADVLKLTGSIRYDKNQNFKAQLSPRLSAVLTVAKVHNIRASFQRGFRIPTTQDQYIDLNTPSYHIIGGLPFLKERYGFSSNPAYTLQSVQAFGAALQTGGQAALPQALSLLRPVTSTSSTYDPERVETYEVGYKGLLGNRLFIDAYYYYNRFLNFLGSEVAVQGKQPATVTNPASTLQLISGSTRTIYSYPVNSPTQLKNAGWAVGLDYLLPGNYTIGANVSSNYLIDKDKIPEGFVTQFNTPKYRYNLSFGNRNVSGTGIGFNVVWRAQESFLWESSFANAEATARQQTIIPAFSTLDAQISKKLAAFKSILKVGGTNLTGKLYTQSWGNPSVGSMYYISLTFDQLMN